MVVGDTTIPNARRFHGQGPRAGRDLAGSATAPSSSGSAPRSSRAASGNPRLSWMRQNKG